MSHKKSKGNSSKKKYASHSKNKKPNSKASKEEAKVPSSQLNPQDRVAFVKPLWESLRPEERVQLLTVSVEDVIARIAKSELLDNGVSLETVYQRGRERLDREGTWKVWQWDATTDPFTCAETFRKEALEKKVAQQLLSLLPREEGKPLEKPAEAALRERMTNLINNIHSQLQTAQDAWRRGQRTAVEPGETTRDANIDLVISILDTLQHEHHCLYQMILTPVAEFICNLVPAESRKSTKTELFFEDLDRLIPEDVARLYEWLTEKVDALCSKLKPDPKDEDVDEDEEAVGDIDLFSLTDDKSTFTVNPKWMEHLQERKLSEEGQPRKVKTGEDEHKVGLVLEWVYGSIVSTAEKARDGAKRQLGGWKPSVEQAYSNLMEALKDQFEWDQRSKTAKGLLKDLLAIRKRMLTLGKDHNVCIPGTSAARESGSSCDELPDDVIEGILCRESLLTDAKLHILKYDRMMATNQLKNLRTELLQGEPEFERLKRELENAKNVARASEKERLRSKMTDSLLEDHLEVQSAFREQGARLQGLYDKRQRTEMEMARREQEINQLENWKKNVNQLKGKIQAGIAQAVSQAKDANAPVDDSLLVNARTSFHKDFKKQLYSDLDDQTFFSRIKGELKQVDKRVEDGAVVLQHLEMFLINIACDDPGALIGTSVILPLLQERLDEKAMEFSMQKASEAMNALLQMEEEKKINLAKKETKKKNRVPSPREENLPEAIPSLPEEIAAEVEETKTEEAAVKEDASEEEHSGENLAMSSLADLPLDDPVLMEKSRQYEEALLGEDEEFQSVCSRRRSDRKKFQQQGRKVNSVQNAGTSPTGKWSAASGGKTSNYKTNQGAVTEQGKKLKPSAGKQSVVLGSRSKSAKLTTDGKTNKSQAWDQQKQKTSHGLKKTQSLPETQTKESEENKTSSKTSLNINSNQVTQSIAWVKGAIPASVISKPSNTVQQNEDSANSTFSQKSSVSESSLHIPSTPDAMDGERTSDKTPMTLQEIKTALPQQSDIQELPEDALPSPAAKENLKGEENYCYQAKVDGDLSNMDGDEDEDRESDVESRVHSSDSETPEPEHMMMGPPLMPPPMGMPPPIGPMPPPFHPNYYSQMRPMMNGMNLPVPPHLPPVYHPSPMTGPMTSVPESTEPGSPSTSSPGHSALPPHPTFTPPYYHPGHPHVIPHSGHHLPMPPYPMVMPYGQWFPPGMPMIGVPNDHQIKNFPLRPTAEEFVPPSLRQENDSDENIETGDGSDPVEQEEEGEEIESEDQNQNEKEDQDETTTSTDDFNKVELPEVKESSTMAVTPIIKQTC